MKKIFALLLALFICFGVFTACGKEKEDDGRIDSAEQMDYTVFEKAMEKTQELDSLYATMKMDISMSAEGISMEIPVDMILKIKDVKSENPVIYANVSMTMMGMNVQSEMYQEDGWGYYINNGEKYKVNLAEEVGLDYTHNLESLIQELPEKIMKKAKIKSKADGSMTLTVSLEEGDVKEYFGEYMADMGYGIDNAAIKKATVSMTAKNGYLTFYEIDMEMDIEVEGIVTNGRAKISATYENPGKEVKITPPAGYKEFPDRSGADDFISG